jgi:hypothetical protein
MYHFICTLCLNCILKTVFLKNCYQLSEIQRSPTCQLSSLVYDCNSGLSGHEDQRMDIQTRGIRDFGRFIFEADSYVLTTMHTSEIGNCV